MRLETTGTPTPPILTEEELEENLSRPTAAVVEALSHLDGDLVVIGAGGKMGPTLARMARRALDQVDASREVFAVSRFSESGSRSALEWAGVRTIGCDLLDRTAVDALPDAGAVVFMAGVKFGTNDGPARTWATNCYAAGLAAERYATIPTVVFSTGNVYPLVPIEGGGASETTPPAPIGDYAQSALGRERTFEFFSRERGTPVVLFRLNYAVELRYGVLRDLAERFGELLGKRPAFSGEEAPTALLSDASLAVGRLGRPATSVGTAVEWVADWVRRGGRSLAKPTHFERRDGRF